MAERFHIVLEKGAFRRLGMELMFLEGRKNLPYVIRVFVTRLAEDEDVIKVNGDKWEVSEQGVHQCLEGRRSVGESKGNYEVFKVLRRSYESSLGNVRFVNLDLVVR